MTFSFENIKFSEIFLTGSELGSLARALHPGTAREVEFGRNVINQIKKTYKQAKSVYVTSSIAAAYEMLCDLAELGPGDTVIMPSFIGVEPANTFVRRGASIRFIDSGEKNFLIDINCLESQIDNTTKIILCNSYQGANVDLSYIAEKIKKNKNIILVEDLTQSFGLSNAGKVSHIDYHVIDFHHNNYVHAFEAGALISNCDDSDNFDLYKNRGLRIPPKKKGEPFDWIAKGGEYATNELTSSFLSAQLDQLEYLKQVRRNIWNVYSKVISDFDANKFLGLPLNCKSINAVGNFFVTLPSKVSRVDIIDDLSRLGVETRGHYMPLHLTEQGRKICDVSLPNIEKTYSTILRLPSHNGMKPENIVRTIKLLLRVLENRIKND
jgi:dTDP-4-amino-4,6-dideoxygalactose transaminase